MNLIDVANEKERNKHTLVRIRFLSDRELNGKEVSRRANARQNAELSFVTVINYLRLRVTLHGRRRLNGKP